MPSPWHTALALSPLPSPLPSLADPFTLWRYLLLLVVTIYTTIVLVQTAWSYYLYLSPRDRYTSLLRRYVALHSLRVRARSFGPDLTVCGLLLLALGLLAMLHYQALNGHL